MNQFKKNIQKNAFDEDAMLAQLYQHADKDGLRPNWAKAPKEPAMKKRNLWFIGLAVVLAVAIIVSNPFSYFNKDKTNVVAAIISVDINPSFELSVNNAGIVIKIEALNADAQSIDTSALLHESAEVAVESIVALAIKAGFIDTADLEDDYVVVSTVLMSGTKAELGDTLQTKLRDRIHLSDPLQCVDLVQIKATLQERQQARDKDVPVGLYIINGSIQNQNGAMLSVKEFFANDANRAAIQQRAQITLVSETKIRLRIETVLKKMDDAGISTIELRTRLQNANLADMLKIQSEVRTRINAPVDPGNGGSGTENGSGNGTQQGTDSGNGSGTQQGTQTQTGITSDSDSGITESGQPTDSGTGSDTSGQPDGSGTGGSGTGTYRFGNN
ncbi:MAG: hypothetical protein WBL80_01440 [Erysipelotrichaceae bacterium]